MALGTPSFLASPVGGETSVTTGSAIPTANAGLIAFIGCRLNGAVPATPTISSSPTLTWTARGLFTFDDGGTARFKIRVLTTKVSAAPAAMTVTAQSTGAQGISLAVLKITGASTDLTNIGSAGTTTGSPNVTLPNVPAASSTVLGYVLCGLNNVFTPPAEMTELWDTGFSTTIGNLRHTVDHDPAPAVQSYAWGSSNARGLGVCVEVKESAENLTIASSGSSCQALGHKVGMRSATVALATSASAQGELPPGLLWTPERIPTSGVV